MGFNVFLQILRALECLATEITLVWLQRNVDSNVRGDMVTFYGGSPTATPLASQVEVVCALSANMAFANVFLRQKRG